jgi:hypothetical protein
MFELSLELRQRTGWGRAGARPHQLAQIYPTIAYKGFEDSSNAV